MIQHQVQQLLADWREAERELEVADDERRAEELRARVAELRDAYQRVIATAQPSETEPA